MVPILMGDIVVQGSVLYFACITEACVSDSSLTSKISLNFIYTLKTQLEISGNPFMGHLWKDTNLQVPFKYTYF